jgi:ABC-type sulfate/molybdate transport systems ATPase subunit
MVAQLKGLAVEGVVKRIADFELRADFAVAHGERVALLGASGSGKTSLLRVLAGLESADAGRILLDGRELTRLSPEQRDIGVIFQEQALFPALNVLDNATFGLRMRGVAASEREKLGLEWLERVGLGARARANVGLLSGGERQRVAFVRAAIWEPRMLLLDEPFSALDPSLRSSLRQELVRIHSYWPVPLLLVTHDEADVAEIATRRLSVQIDGKVRTVCPSPRA